MRVETSVRELTTADGHHVRVEKDEALMPSGAVYVRLGQVHDVRVYVDGEQAHSEPLHMRLRAGDDVMVLVTSVGEFVLADL